MEDSQFRLLSSEPDSQSAAPEIINENSYQGNDVEYSDHNYNQSKPNRKIVKADDFLLHRLNSRKMKVNNIPSVRLTKRRDNLSGLFLVFQPISASIIISTWILCYWLARMTFLSETSPLKI